MVKKITISSIALFLSVVLCAQQIKYTAAAQQKYLPEVMEGIFLGMTYDEFKEIESIENLEYEVDYFDSIAKLTRYYRVGASLDEVRSAIFYFTTSAVTSDAASIPGKSRLFSIVLEFDKTQDADVFVQGYKNNKAIKGSLSEKGWKWVFKSSDDVNWVVTYISGFVSITGNIKGTPWKKVID